MENENDLLSLFYRNSPIHVLSECKNKLSLIDRLQLFGYDVNTISLLNKLLGVKCVSDQLRFTTTEVKRLEEMNLRLDIPRVYFLTEENDMAVMEKFISLGYYEEIPQEHYTMETMNIAAKLGKVRAMAFLHERKCPWNECTPMRAAENGHLSCLQYAHSHGCPWNEYTPARAAGSGHLDCLQYAHENGCCCKHRISVWAAEGGHLDCLKYAHENGFPWQEETPFYAAENGHLDCLKYAHENGCPWDEYAPLWAEKNKHLHSLK